MKKLIASFTVIVYFAFACGVMVNYHYCMDRYTSFGLFAAAGDQCATCGMSIGNKGCCHDEVKIVKLQNDYQTSSFVFSGKLAAPAIIIPSGFLASPLFNEKKLNKSDHSPPLRSFHDIYLQNCTFRI
jgi:hypothetical protein